MELYLQVLYTLPSRCVKQRCTNLLHRTIMNDFKVLILASFTLKVCNACVFDTRTWQPGCSRNSSCIEFVCVSWFTTHLSEITIYAQGCGLDSPDDQVAGSCEYGNEPERQLNSQGVGYVRKYGRFSSRRLNGGERFMCTITTLNVATCPKTSMV